MVRDAAELPGAMVNAFAYGDTALVERFVAGRRGRRARRRHRRRARARCRSCRSTPDGGVYDYTARYTAGSTEFQVPAKLDDDVAAECARVAVAAHEALGLRDLSRSDLIVDDDGTVWFLEVNVAPGLTETSTVPLSVQAAGLDLGELVADLVRTRPSTGHRAEEAHDERPHLLRRSSALAQPGSRRMDFRFQVTGQEHIPRTGGAVLAINHVSYVDFIMAGYGARWSKRLVRFMAKRETFDHQVTGPLMRSCHHISVDRADGSASYDEAVRYLRDGEVVGIFPEATISRSFLIKELKTGAVRMAADADVPLVPMVLWGTQRLITKDHPRDFSRAQDDHGHDRRAARPAGRDRRATKTAELHAAMTAMLDKAIRAYPAEEQPPGSWWLPASYGGSAPTPERGEASSTARRCATRGEGRAPEAAPRRSRAG